MKITSFFNFDNDDTIEDFNLQTEQNINDNIIEQQDDLFEEIVIDECNENIIFNIIKKSSMVEDFIDSFIKSCNLQSIGWLNKY